MSDSMLEQTLYSLKFMNKILLSLSFILVLLFSQGFANAQKTEAGKISGLYWSPKKDAKIEIYRKGEKYFGKTKIA